MSKTGQYLGHLKAYKDPHTKLPTVIFVAREKRLPWQQRSLSISRLSEDIEGQDLAQT